MHNSPSELPGGLQRCYDDLADRYDRALVIAVSLPAAFETGTHAEPELQQLADTMIEVGAVEKRLATARQQWEAAGHQMTEELQAAVVRVRELLVQLIDSISLAEQHAQDARSKLNPRLNAQTVSQRMRTAYAASANT